MKTIIIFKKIYTKLLKIFNKYIYGFKYNEKELKFEKIITFNKNISYHQNYIVCFTKPLITYNNKCVKYNEQLYFIECKCTPFHSVNYTSD